MSQELSEGRFAAADQWRPSAAARANVIAKRRAWPSEHGSAPALQLLECRRRTQRAQCLLGCAGHMKQLEARQPRRRRQRSGGAGVKAHACAAPHTVPQLEPAQRRQRRSRELRPRRGGETQQRMAGKRERCEAAQPGRARQALDGVIGQAGNRRRLAVGTRAEGAPRGPGRTRARAREPGSGWWERLSACSELAQEGGPANSSGTPPSAARPTVRLRRRGSSAAAKRAASAGVLRWMVSACSPWNTRFWGCVSGEVTCSEMSLQVSSRLRNCGAQGAALSCKRPAWSVMRLSATTRRARRGSGAAASSRCSPLHMAVVRATDLACACRCSSCARSSGEEGEARWHRCASQQPGAEHASLRARARLANPIWQARSRASSHAARRPRTCICGHAASASASPT
jgi:hypothetical protein